MDQNTKDVLMMAIPAVSAAITAYVAFKTARLNTKVEAMANDVLRVEKATNGHMALLVKATAAAAQGEGKEQERTEQKAREAERAAGAAEAKDSTP